MPTILLDGSHLDLAPPTATWGGVLRLLDDRLTGDGRIVTDVRFDGVDEPAFREPDTLERPLADLAVLEVMSGTPDGLMDRCLAEGISAVPSLCAAALDVGESFRALDLTPANAGLGELADGLTSLLGIVGAAGLAFQIDLRDLPCGDQPAAAVVSELGSFLEQLIAAQEVGDWITVADVLQYDVEPSLRRLVPVLESLRQQPLASASA